jgi:hypothetical protein
MKALKILKYVGFGILGIGFVFLCIWLVMALWNWLIPGLFHGPVLTYWQTAGLFLLTKILLSGMAMGSQTGKPRKKWKEKYHGKYGPCCPEEEVKPSAEDV